MSYHLAPFAGPGEEWHDMTRNSRTTPGGRGTLGEGLKGVALYKTPSENGLSKRAFLWEHPGNAAYPAMGCHETGVVYGTLNGTDLPCPGPVVAGVHHLLPYPRTVSGTSCFPCGPDQGAFPLDNNHEADSCHEGAGLDRESRQPQVVSHPAGEAGSRAVFLPGGHPHRDAQATPPGDTGSRTRVEGTFPALRPCRNVEFLARDLLMKNGYDAVRVTSPEVPVDIVAWKRSGLLLIGVVRTRAPVHSAQKAIERCASLVAGLRSITCPAGCSVQLWFYSSRSGWRFYTVHPHGLMEVPADAWA